MKRRFWWTILILLAIAVGLFAWYRHRLSSEVRRRLAAIQQAGYPVTAEDLDAWHAAVPLSENAAPAILQAAQAAWNPKQWLGREQWPRRDRPWTAEQAQAVSEIVTNNLAALEILHQASVLAKARYPVDWSAGFATLLPHLASVKRLSQLLALEALWHGEKSEIDLAVHSLLTAFHVARSLDSEPCLISQLVRIACVETTLDALERLLTQRAISDSQLRSLLDAVRDAEKANRPGFARAAVRQFEVDGSEGTGAAKTARARTEPTTRSLHDQPAADPPFTAP